jgi:hypothetical protein
MIKLKTIYELLHTSVEKFSNNIAFTMFGGEDVTYREVLERVEQVQEMLLGAGLKPGDKVALLSSSMPNWGVCYFAVTTAEFSKDHTDLNFDYPLCTATRYNFHQAEGYAIDWYSENMIENAIKDQFYEGYWEITLKFSDKQTMDKASNYLYGNFNRIKNSLNRAKLSAISNFTNCFTHFTEN